MKYRIPRTLFKRLEENLGDLNSAEQFASSLEEAVEEINRRTAAATVDKVSSIKMDIKDDLSNTLVTREMFQALHEHMDFKFQSMEEDMDHRFHAMQEQMDHRFHAMQEQMEHGFHAMQEQMNNSFHSIQNQMEHGFAVVDQKFAVVDQKFAVVDQKFAVVNEKFLRLENKVDERFKRMDIKFNFLIGILVAGFTVFNPGFLELLKSLLR